MSTAHSRPVRKRAAASPTGRVLVGGAVLSTVLLIGLPLLAVFTFSLRDGVQAYWRQLTSPDCVHALKLTLLASGVAVPVSTVFGVVAAWAVAKHRFPGSRLLTSLIELPLSISPILFGVSYLFVFGMQGLLGPWLDEHGLALAFNVPALVIITTLVTAPYVFREILPLMQTQGTDEETAAVILGAGGWNIFWRVTYPNIRWALLYGVTLCFARSLGEFGAVAVVSGAIRGETNTLTLHIELLANDRSGAGSFAVASILTSVALVTLAIKAWAERRSADSLSR